MIESVAQELLRGSDEAVRQAGTAPAVAVTSHDYPLVIDPKYCCRTCARNIDRGKDSTTQQKSLSAVLVNKAFACRAVQPHDVPGIINSSRIGSTEPGGSIEV
jgi:hypothetical protein